MAGHTAISGEWSADRVVARLAAQSPASWMGGYRRQTVAADGICALAAGLLAFEIRFDSPHGAPLYLLLSFVLPLLWVTALGLAGGYDTRFIGVGSDEFRRVLNAGVFLTAAVAVAAYASKSDLARGYVVAALPTLTLLDLLARFTIRKSHR